MGDMILYLAMATAGYVLASRIRNQKDKFKWTGLVQTVAIIGLVLLMGMRMGSNQEIIDNLGTIGVTAFAMTIVVQAFSVGFLVIARKFMRMDRFGYVVSKEEMASMSRRKARDRVNNATGAGASVGNSASSNSGSSAGTEKPKRTINKMTVIILCSVIIGMIVGYLIIMPAFEGKMDVFTNFASTGIKIGLCILIFLVGMDLGFVGDLLKNMKDAGIRVIIIPAVILLGTLIGGIVIGLPLGLTLTESLAVAGGMGWYSLAPGIIMEAGHITASAVSFLHNVFREVFTILLVPTIASKVGYLETIAMAASPSMDVCLPIIEKSTAPHVAVYSFISGAILSFLVPVIVSLFIGI